MLSMYQILIPLFCAVSLPPSEGHMSPHLRHSPATPPPRQLQEALEGLDRWDFDIMRLEQVCTETQRWGPLFFVGLRIFKEFNVGETLDVDETIIGQWLKVGTFFNLLSGVCQITVGL